MLYPAKIKYPEDLVISTGWKCVAWGILLLGSILSTAIYAQNPAPQPLPCHQLHHQNISGHSEVYLSSNCIEVQGNTIHNTTQGGENLIIQAKNKVEINPPTSLGTMTNGKVQIITGPPDIETAWFLPVLNPGTVPKHHKLEVGCILPVAETNSINTFFANGGGINPFDPEQISLQIEFTSPSGNTKTVYGFYYEQYETANNAYFSDHTDYKFRVRFYPDEIGTWTAKVSGTVNGSVYLSGDNFSFNCVSSSHGGHISLTHSGLDVDRYLTLSETGNTFFAIATNISHADYYNVTPNNSVWHRSMLQDFASNGGNFCRVEIGGQNALPDWNDATNYISKMEEMWEYDQLFDLGHLLDVYFLTFRHHVEVTEDIGDVTWDNNPYNNGPAQGSLIAYFTNPQVTKLQKNTLRYIMSRWGQSPNFAFYGYSEVDYWIKGLTTEMNSTQPVAIQVFRDWLLNQKAFVKVGLDMDKTLFACSYAGIPDWEYDNPALGVLAHSDIIPIHKYGDTKDINYESRYKMGEKCWNKWKKPFVFEEIGYELPAAYCCTDIDFHRDIWATSLMGGFGTGMHWWWESTHGYNYFPQYQDVKSFFEGEDPKFLSYSPERWIHGYSGLPSIKKAKLEAYYLRSNNKEKILGYVANATYYWRNLESTNNCISELVNYLHLFQPCTLANGFLAGIPLPHESYYYYKQMYTDEYTSTGGKEVVYGGSLALTGLKTNVSQALPGSKKHWYKTEFFPSRLTNNLPLHTVISHTNIAGELLLTVPVLNDINMDYSFKTNYLGFSQNPPSFRSAGPVVIESEEDSGINNKVGNTDALHLNIYPNPCTDFLNVESKKPLSKVNIFNLTGKLCLSVVDFQHAIYVGDLARGAYFIEIWTSDGSVHKRFFSKS